jgi:LysR family transcriptional regulator, regulator for metE and metH
MDIDIRHLRMIEAIAATGSVTHAAETLHLTQSAVSHQLRGIEERLATPLFLRLGKKMVATAAGGRLLATARRVLHDLDTTEEEVRRLGSHQAGVLRVCAQCNTGYHWLPAVIEAFRRTHPDVDVSLAIDCTATPIAGLLDGRVDVAIVTERVRHQHVRVRPLFADEHAAIVAPDHPFARRPFISADDLARERLLLYASSPGDSFTIQRILRPAGVTAPRVSFVMLTEALLEMVKARLGVAVMQTWAVEPALRSGDVRAVRITPRGIRRQWSAATLAKMGRVPYVEAFIDLLARESLVSQRQHRVDTTRAARPDNRRRQRGGRKP